MNAVPAMIGCAFLLEAVRSGDLRAPSTFVPAGAAHIERMVAGPTQPTQHQPARARPLASATPDGRASARRPAGYAEVANGSGSLAGKVVCPAPGVFLVPAGQPRIERRAEGPSRSAQRRPARGRAFIGPESRTDARRAVLLPRERKLLFSGLRAYLSGDFDLAIRYFEQIAAAKPTDAEIHILLGSALYSAWALESGDEKSLLFVRARSELRAAARLNRSLEPNPRFYSPKIIALYESTR